MSETSKRFLIVGSLLRPESLLTYKRQIEKRDDIQYPFYQDFEGYEAVEDAAVTDIVKAQIAQGLPEITDGEFSKSLWHLDFVWGLSGVHRYIAEHGYFFRDHDQDSKYETRRDIGIEFKERVCCDHHPFIRHYQRLEELAPEGVELKQCVPSPSHVYGELGLMSKNVSGKVYASRDELKADLTQAYKDFLNEFKKAGGKIVQFDDCLWELFASDNHHSPFSGKDYNSEEVQNIAKEFIDLNNEIIAYAHDLGIKVYTHNCRGNYDSRNMADGSYETIADLFLKSQNYDRFYLEWDDERAGNLTALKAFADKPEAEVVLGFLSSKTTDLDDEARTLQLLQEATQYVAKDKLYLSHQCGFASCDNGNALTEAQQWAKIAQGQKIARQFWGE